MSNLDAEYDTYIKTAIKLVGSLVVKSTHSIKDNNNYLKNLGYVIDDAAPTTWKYYLNLAGEYHESDTPMTVRSLDDQSVISFDKNTLSNHPNTLAEYRAKGNYYDSLVTKYSGQKILIDRILEPLDINECIAAPNWKILTHDHTLVGSGEYGLIDSLQAFINKTCARWVVEGYAEVDELYSSAWMGTLTMLLVQELITTRLRNVRTDQVHEYHLWNHLSNFYRLDQFQGKLFHRQALWLYRNIEWLVANLGTNRALEFLNEGFAKPYGLDLYRYDFRKDSTNLATDLKSEITVSRTPLDRVAIADDEGSILSIDEVVKRVREEADLTDDDNGTIVASLVDRLRTYSQGTIPTKIIEVNRNVAASSLLVNRQRLRLALWSYLATRGNYQINKTVNVPGHGTIVFSPANALALYLYVGGILAGYQPTDIAEYEMMGVPITPPQLDSELEYVIEPKYLPDGRRDAIRDNIPATDTAITNVGDFELLLEEVVNKMIVHNVVLAKCQNSSEYAQVSEYISQFYCNYKQRPTMYMTYQEMFTDLQLDFSNYSTSNFETLFLVLGQTFGGIKETNEGLISPYYEMVEILKILTSYDTRIVIGAGLTPGSPMHPESSKLDDIVMESGSDTVIESGVHEWGLVGGFTELTVIQPEANKESVMDLDTYLSAKLNEGDLVFKQPESETAFTPFNVIGNVLSSIRILGEFDPEQLFEYGEVGAFYLPIKEYCWQDLAKTIPVTGPGQPVKVIEDLFRSGKDLVFPASKTGTFLGFDNYGGVSINKTNIESTQFTNLTDRMSIATCFNYDDNSSAVNTARVMGLVINSVNHFSSTLRGDAQQSQTAYIQTNELGQVIKELPVDSLPSNTDCVTYAYFENNASNSDSSITIYNDVNADRLTDNCGNSLNATTSNLAKVAVGNSLTVINWYGGVVLDRKLTTGEDSDVANYLRAIIPQIDPALTDAGSPLLDDSNVPISKD